MTPATYRYRFSAAVPPEEIEATLLLALWGTQSLHGEAQVKLDALHAIDRDRRTCEIDGSTVVGTDLNRLFAGYMQREFGAETFVVERKEQVPPHSACLLN